MTAKNIFNIKLIIIKPLLTINNRIFSIILTLFLFAIAVSAFGQRKDWKPLFPVENLGFRLSGWYVGAGATYTFGLPSTTENTYQFEDDTKIIAQYSAAGAPGFLLEGGRYTMLYSRFIPYIDYGISFKMVGGIQDYTAYHGTVNNPDTLSTSSASASFNNYYISAHFNANNAIRISEYGFIQNSLGANLDYKAIGTIKGSYPVFEDTKQEAEIFLFQLHYKLGYGFRLDKKHFLIFTFETPLLTIFPQDNKKPTIALFNSQYLPVLFSVRLLFLRNNTRPDCNKPTDIKMEKKRKKPKLF